MFACRSVIKHSGKTHRPQHSQPVFRESLRRIANCAHQFCVDISAAADEIDHVIRDRIIKHSVDREIAPFRVFVRRRKMHRARMPSVDVSLVRAKGRDLKLKTVLQHDDHAKMRTDRVTCAEKVSAQSRALRRWRCRNPSALNRAPCRARNHRRSTRYAHSHANAQQLRARPFP